MKAVKFTLTTYLTYYDKTEQREVELEDEMAAQLQAFANGKEVTNEDLQEGLPDVYDEIEFEAYNRARELLIIDGYKNYGECFVVNEPTALTSGATTLKRERTESLRFHVSGR